MSDLANMRIGIDPGPHSSGVVVIGLNPLRVMFSERLDNDEIVIRLRGGTMDLGQYTVVIERIVSYGKPVGNDTFMTAEWAGRFAEANLGTGRKSIMITRPSIKVVLCGGTTWLSEKQERKKVSDAMLKAVVMGKFPATGGGAKPAIGTAKQPGPLFTMPPLSKGGDHCWAALSALIAAREVLVK